MALTIFYVAAAIGVLLIGAGVFWACWQVAATIKTVRQTLLPQVELTLTEVQRNLNQIDQLTQDVDSTVGEATQLVNTANRTAAAVEQGLDSFNKRVATPALIRLASAVEGVKVGVGRLRAKRQPPALMVVEEPGAVLIEQREPVTPSTLP